MTMTRDERIERFSSSVRKAREVLGMDAKRGDVWLEDAQAVLDRLGELEGAVELARTHARRMRNSGKLVGPYKIPHERKIWERTLYHAGKDLDEGIRAALTGSIRG